ncbi:MAG: hypothetical protein K1W19_14325 [Lachnospiraceae bacterium]|nr:hypothetical protein [Lachnospiraceae bacterium]
MNEGNVNISKKVVTEELKIITISQEEYKELLAASVKLEVIVNFVNTDKYVESSEIKRILGIYKEEEK